MNKLAFANILQKAFHKQRVVTLSRMMIRVIVFYCFTGYVVFAQGMIILYLILFLDEYGKENGEDCFNFTLICCQWSSTNSFQSVCRFFLRLSLSGFKIISVDKRRELKILCYRLCRKLLKRENTKCICQVQQSPR